MSKFCGSSRERAGGGVMGKHALGRDGASAVSCKGTRIQEGKKSKKEGNFNDQNQIGRPQWEGRKEESKLKLKC